MIWSGSLSFEGLFTVGVDLVLIDAVKVFSKGIESSGVVAYQDLESGDLVEVERTVVAEPREGQSKIMVWIGEVQTWWQPSPLGQVGCFQAN